METGSHTIRKYGNCLIYIHWNPFSVQVCMHDNTDDAIIIKTFVLLYTEGGFICSSSTE